MFIGVFSDQKKLEKRKIACFSARFWGRSVLRSFTLFLISSGLKIRQWTQVNLRLFTSNLKQKKNSDLTYEKNSCEPVLRQAILTGFK